MISVFNNTIQEIGAVFVLLKGAIIKLVRRYKDGFFVIYVE